MDAKVLIYNDDNCGASEECVLWTISSLTQCLESLKQNGYCSQYSIDTTTASQVLSGEWRHTTKLLVMPGGRDLPYVEALAGKGNEMIKEFVISGGAYLGLCAGGYYGASEVEFEKSNPSLRICGSRELRFFPGKACGTILPGFQYESHKGAHSVTIQTINSTAIETPVLNNSTINVYYNGGCEFVPNKEASKKQPYNVIAMYQKCDQCETGYAIISCNHGNGCVVLSGVHIETEPAALGHLPQLVPSITSTDTVRRQLFASIIKYLLKLRI